MAHFFAKGLGLTAQEFGHMSVGEFAPKITEKDAAAGMLSVVVILLAAVSAIRMIAIAHVPLTGDEAYYWQWSRHLALGYHDHPPLVGWLIWASSFFGTSAFWVRFPSLLLSFCTAIFLFLLAEDLWGKDKPAFRSVCLLVSIPIFSISALAIFPDAPLIFSWAFFLWGAWKWLSDERIWPWVGLALGLAGLSKLMGLFLFPSFFLFLWFSNRARLKKVSLWKAVGLAFLICFPFLFWNFTHHFETFVYQPHQRITRGVSFAPGYFLNYASLQVAALSPFVFILFLGTLGMLFSKARHGDLRARYLLAMTLPIHLFFIAISFFLRVGLHWALPGYLSILAAAPIWAEKLKRRGKFFGKTFFPTCLVTSTALSIFVFSLLLWPQALVPWISSLGIRHGEINHGKALTSQSMAEILGYQELGEHVRADMTKWDEKKPGGSFVFTDSYSLSSVISFYAHLDTKTLLFTSTGGDYDRWNYFERSMGQNALYVDTQPIGMRPDIDTVLHKAFRSIQPLAPLAINRGAIQAGTFYFARCVDLTHPKALRPIWRF